MVRTELRKIIGKDVFCVAKSDDDTYAVVSVPWRHIRRKTQNHRPCKTGRKKPFPRGAAGAGATKQIFCLLPTAAPARLTKRD